MSRKGKQPITIPKGVEAKISKSEFFVKGPKGQLQKNFPDYIHVKQEGSEIHVTADEKIDDSSAFHGLWRALLNNMVQGVSEGFTKKLEMVGVGYRAAVKGKAIDVQIGQSHPTLMEIPEGITVTVEKNTAITITGADKQKVGQFAADIRAKKPPEPYQGKGIKYSDEHIRRKQGKASGK